MQREDRREGEERGRVKREEWREGGVERRVRAERTKRKKKKKKKTENMAMADQRTLMKSNEYL